MGIHNENWKQFFCDPNEGIGTVYDRVILKNFFNRFITKNKIKNVLDCPSFGMVGFSGLNSLYLAKKGIKVTICDDNSERLNWIETLWNKVGLKADFLLIKDYTQIPLNEQSFDLVWNLSALWHLKRYEIDQIIEELWRVTKKILFISVYNLKQIPFPIWKLLDPEYFQHIKLEYSEEKILENIFKTVSMTIEESGYFVTTPWPGITLKKEQIFTKILGMKNDETKNTHIHQLKDMKTPSYMEHIFYPILDEKIEKLMLLERFPNFFKKYWGHLKYWIFIRDLEL